MSAVARCELFPHDADVGVRGYGPSREAAFEQGARALMQAIGAGDAVAPRDRVRITCEAPHDDVLFVDWLNALIFEIATRSMLFSRFHVGIDDGRLRAEAWGEPIDPDRHELAVEAKGATFTALKVAEERPGHWVVQCVVDV